MGHIAFWGGQFRQCKAPPLIEKSEGSILYLLQTVTGVLGFARSFGAVYKPVTS